MSFPRKRPGPHDDLRKKSVKGKARRRAVNPLPEEKIIGPRVGQIDDYSRIPGKVVQADEIGMRNRLQNIRP